MVNARTLLLLLLGGATSIRAAEFADLEQRLGGKIGVVAIDPARNRRIEFSPNERFKMCSTFKLLAAAAVLRRVDHGQDQLDRFIKYTRVDLLEYAPVTKQHVDEGGMKLGDLCQAAIAQSDNTAANLLLSTLGGPSGVTEFARQIGDQVTRLDQKEPELNDSKPGDDRDTTTPAAMCQDLLRLLTSDVLSDKARGELEAWLIANETGGAMIRAAVPKTWQVGDKTGRSGDGTTNDVAIVRPDHGGPIFIAIYSKGAKVPVEERFAVIAETARRVFAELVK